MAECKKILSRVCQFIAHPMEEDPIGFVLFFLLFSGIHIVECAAGRFIEGCGYFAFAFCQFYAFFLLLTFSKKVYSIVKPVLAVLLLLYFIASFFCYTKFSCSFSPDITSLILATNSQEAKEFITVYLEGGDIPVFIVFVIFFVIIYVFSCKCRIRLVPIVQKCQTLVLLVLTIGIIGNWVVATNYWRSLWNFRFDELVDLSLHYTHPSIRCSDEELPDKVIVIIGESFTPTHSSLYGYPIETNPCLGVLQKESSLYVFRQVESPGILTIQSFKHILNTHLISETESNWYESTTIIEFLKEMGYSTHWLSNQAKSGIYENVSSAFAKICDSNQFVYDSRKDRNFDENILDLKVPENKRQALFYHLMGQHEGFYYRYPSRFDFFSDSLYCSFPSIQTEPRKTYDNATLYNDYICNEIIQKYQADDAIVFYFPDHGLDFYDVDDYYGHGRLDMPEAVAASKKIPFLVYLSSECRIKHPDIQARIIEEKDRPLCTDAFTFLVMRLLNVSI